MEDTVGAIFDDRADFPEKWSFNEVLPTSIVQVYRSLDDQRNSRALRFGSLMPDSSARPQKRSHPISPQSPPRGPRTLASIEESHGSRANGINGISWPPNKRQRTHEADVNRRFMMDQRLRSMEHQAEELNQVSQGLGTQGSVHQVLDSQVSPVRNRTLNKRQFVIPEN